MTQKAERTEWDRHFLLLIDLIKESFNIKSDRAMCRHLGIHENLISRVRTGIQSVPATVWDVVNKKMRTPEYKAKGFGAELQITNAGMTRGDGSDSNVLGASVSNIDASLTTSEKPSLQTEYAKDLEIANEIIALLTKQLADKQRTIQLLLAKNPK